MVTRGFKDVQRGSKPKGFGSSAPRFVAKASEVPGPGSYKLPRLFDAPSRVMKRTQKLPAYFEEPGDNIELAPLQKVITEDGPDNTDWEDVQDTTEEWLVQSYTTPVPILSDDQMAEIDEIVGWIMGGTPIVLSICFFHEITLSKRCLKLTLSHREALCR
ncbi:Acy1 [Symbiodinium sp. CCMP2592]|nr:Acy1 [Symbiodinium sp. CCMP2592]